jgi:hypothetical protein
MGADRECIGSWTDPQRLCFWSRQRIRWITWRKSQVRQPAAAAGGDGVEASVGGDAVEPRPRRRLLLQRLAPAPGAQECFLEDVLGIFERTQHPIAVDQQLAPVALGQTLELRLVAIAERLIRHTWC